MAKLAFAFQNFYMQKRQLDQAHEKPEKPLDDEMGEFEDPFEDIEEEDEEVVVGGDDEDLEAAPESVYLPGQEIEKGHTLVADQSTYEFLHPMQVEWPCLSFDVVKDNLGLRSKYPMSSLIVAGSQADMPSANKIYIMKISNMYKTGEQDSDEEGSDDDDLDEDPILEYKTIPLNYGVNRIRISDNNMVAAMLDSGTVEIHDVSTHLQSLNVPGIIPAKDTLAHKITKHGSYEGYALDWSSNRLLTGDTKGRIYLTQSSANGWETEANAYLGHTSSVEDLQWSPSQSEVFCSCSADQTIRIWDARQKKPQITVKAHDSDVNVISWNRYVYFIQKRRLSVSVGI